jgi:hypothetical protein
MPNTNPSQFHIHIDAISLEPEFEGFLLNDLGFWRSDFCGHPEGMPHFEPAHHLTQKTGSSMEYKSMLDRVLAYVKYHDTAMEGYIEGEFIPFDVDIPDLPYDAAVSPPFRIHKTNLSEGTFREDEIHITLSRDDSDPRLIKNLLDMGFFAAYLPKVYGVAVVLTVQGTKKQIQELWEPLCSYLIKVGGARNCSIKEERITHWWLSHANAHLPPVADYVEWNV